MRHARIVFMVVLPFSLLLVRPANAQFLDWSSFAASQAECLGVPFEVYQAAIFPTKGEMRNPTKDEKRQQRDANKALSKIPAKKQTECAQRAADEQITGVRTMMKRMASGGQTMWGGVDGLSEATGAEATVQAEGEGKFVLRNIDWVFMTAEVSSGGTQAFSQSMQMLAGMLGANAGTNRVDFYFDQRYGDEDISELARERLGTIQDAIHASTTGLRAHLELGKAVRDANPRIVFTSQ